MGIRNGLSCLDTAIRVRVRDLQFTHPSIVQHFRKGLRFRGVGLGI